MWSKNLGRCSFGRNLGLKIVLISTRFAAEKSLLIWL